MVVRRGGDSSEGGDSGESGDSRRGGCSCEIGNGSILT